MADIEDRLETEVVERSASRADAAKIQEIAPNLPAGLPGGLRNYWYPVLQSEELPAERPRGFTVLGEALVAWRAEDGKPVVARDRCPHRSIRLSVGRVFEGRLQCILHGLRFDASGRCFMAPWGDLTEEQSARLSVATYPAEELGGYVWAYIGDAAHVPPPPLRNEVPEELLKPGEFIWFRLPTEIWKTNWLLAVDGSDGYHAVVLHANSQAVAEKTWTGGMAEHADAPLAERRMKIVRTSHGIRGVSLDADSRPLHHGHFTVDVKGDRFVLPCIHTNPIMPAPGAEPYTSRLWQFPQDETNTVIVRYAVWRAKSPVERERAEKVFNELALPRLKKVSAEDAFACEAQGDVASARREEHLVAPDADVVRVRRLIRKAYMAPLEGAERIAVSPRSLEYPL